MPAILTCPGCRAAVQLPDGFNGPVLRCGWCQFVIPIPTAAPVAPPQPEAPLSLDDAEPAPSPAPRRPAPRPRPASAPFDFDNKPGRPGKRSAPDDDNPKWLLGVAALPVVMVAFGGALGGLIGGLTAGLNALIARQRGMGLPAKLAAMLVVTLVGVGSFFGVRSVIVDALKDSEDETADSRPANSTPTPKRETPPEPRRPDPQPRPQPQTRPQSKPPTEEPPEPHFAPAVENPNAPPAGWNAPVVTFPASAPIRRGVKPDGADTDLIRSLIPTRFVRLPDGPAAATAGHADGKGMLAVGYADGSTAVWDLERPITQAPIPGPKFDAAVTRIWVAGHGRYLVTEAGGRLHVTTTRAPHKGVTVPAGDCGVRLCAFGTAAVVRHGPDGYGANWLVHDWNAHETMIPPPQYGDPFGSLAKLDAPPAEPQFLTWLHTTPAAFLPDGRITVWNGQGKTLTVEAHPKPVRAWAAGPNQVVLTSLDAAGNLQVRRQPDYTIETAIKAGDAPVTRVISDGSGWLTLGADDAGGVRVWEHRDGTRRVIYEATKAGPVVPLGVAWSSTFVVGIGRTVELWSPVRLKLEPGAKK